jgi:integrase/recombinase XerD
MIRGHRVRFVRSSFVSAVAAAERFERELMEHGRLALALTAEDRVDWVRCKKICEPFGVTPVQACEEYAERHKGTRHTFAEVAAEVVALKRASGRSTRYVDALERSLRNLDEHKPGKRIADYTTSDLRDHLKRHSEWQPVTVRGAFQNWSVIFNHAVKFGYRHDNPCKLLELPRVVRKEPTRLLVGDVQRGLNACLTSREMLDCLAWFAIGNFAGLRPEETEQLRWEDVSFPTKSLVVRATTSKRRQRRVVKMEPVLDAWLRPLFREHGRVMPLDLLKTRRLMCRAMELARWPSDVLRHSFASYHFAKWGDLIATRKQMGHTEEESDVFWNHYCALVTPPDQDLFWEIMPPWKSDLDLAAKYLRDIGWSVKMQLRTLALPAPANT